MPSQTVFGSIGKGSQQWFSILVYKFYIILCFHCVLQMIATGAYLQHVRLCRTCFFGQMTNSTPHSQ